MRPTNETAKERPDSELGLVPGCAGPDLDGRLICGPNETAKERPNSGFGPSPGPIPMIVSCASRMNRPVPHSNRAK
jgi:hypothetical protein